MRFKIKKHIFQQPSKPKHSSSKKLGPVGSFVLGIICAAIGIGISYKLGWKNYQEAKESVEWPQVTGTVFHSKVTQRQTRDSEGRSTTSYKANIKYSYTVRGHQMSSSQIYVGSERISSSSYTGAYEYTEKYPVGKSVVVYYSPKVESNAVLEPGVKMEHYTEITIGLIFAVIGLLIVFSSLFKFLIAMLKTGVVIGHVFKRKKRRSYGSPSLCKRSGRRAVGSYARTSFDKPELDINLDSQMSQFNQVSSSSLSVYSEPWKYDWVIKIANKKYGPYPFEKVVSYFKNGKVRGNYECYPSSGGEIIKISDIVHRRAG